MVTEKDVFTHIPEAELWTLLVLDTFNVRVLDPLEIELRYLNRGLANGQEFVYQANDFEVSVNLVLNGRCKPSLGFAAVQETSLSVACFAATSSNSELFASHQEFLDITSGLDLCLKQDDLLSSC